MNFETFRATRRLAKDFIPHDRVKRKSRRCRGFHGADDLFIFILSSAMATMKRVYRYICHSCYTVNDACLEDFTVKDGVGAGHDIDGSYDSGTSVCSVKCLFCNETTTWWDMTIATLIKKKYIFSFFVEK